MNQKLHNKKLVRQVLSNEKSTSQENEESTSQDNEELINKELIRQINEGLIAQAKEKLLRRFDEELTNLVKEPINQDEHERVKVNSLETIVNSEDILITENVSKEKKTLCQKIYKLLFKK